MQTKQAKAKKATPAKKAASKESKTSSTEEEVPPTAEETLAKIAEKMREVGVLFEDVIDLTIDNPKFPPPELRLGEHDLAILYDIRVAGKDTDLIHLRGRQDLPLALHPDQASQVMRKFTQVFSAVIGDPLAAIIQLKMSEMLRAETSVTDEPPITAGFNALPAPEEPDTPEDNGGFVSSGLSDE